MYKLLIRVAPIRPSVLKVKRFNTNKSADKRVICKELKKWVKPLSINRWCKCERSGEKGDFPLEALMINTLKVSAKG